MLLVDSDVLVDYLREQRPAIRFVEGLKNVFAISVITVAELYAGVHDESEETALSVLVSACLVLEIDDPIARLAGAFRRKYGRSHGIQLPDALIAATSVNRQVELVTLNRRHYPMLEKLTVPYRKAR